MNDTTDSMNNTADSVNAATAPLGWKVRHDGSLYPDDDVEAAVLAPNPNPGPTADNRDLSVGDLIVRALCHGMCPGSPDRGEDWQSFENSVLETLAVDLRVLALAYNGGDAESPEAEFEGLTDDELLRAVHGLARRADAAAQLCQRLRQARWGHPSFGGASEEFLVKMAAPKGEEPEAEPKTEEPEE
ncbi:MAG: hypothetical protein JW940_00555 [Polyangiaceae bacterium]|nr:hypothetical protein [Polyangiaceae bacterium]